MKIWIVNYYTVPPTFARNERHLKFSHYLKEAGYDITIFCAQHPASGVQGMPEKGQLFKETTYGEHKFVHVKVKPYKGNGLARMISIFQFAWRILVHRKRFEKPDVILHNIHEPFDYPILWCAKKFGAKYIAEDWDLWSRSFVQMGFLKKDGIISKIVFCLAENLFSKADRIIFTMEGGQDYISDMKWDTSHGGKVDLKKIYYINNGIDIMKFDDDAKNDVLDDADLLDDNYFKIVYLGSIKQANNVLSLIEAAKLLLNQPKLKFLIYGDGQDREFLEEYCEKEKITNVVFKQKSIPLSQVPFVLTHSNLNLLNYYKSFGQYGVSSGKLFQYLASGKPICCNLDLRKYDIITRNRIGIAKSYNSSTEYAEAIKAIAELPDDEYAILCKNARDTAYQFDYKVLSYQLIDILKTL